MTPLTPSTALRINLTPLTLDNAQEVNLWLSGRPVAGVSGTVGSVPASLRRLLTQRPDLMVAQFEVTTVLGALLRPTNDDSDHEAGAQ